MSRRCRRPRQCQATVYSEACSYNSCPGHSHKDSIQRSTRNTVIKTASREAPGTESQRPRPEKHPEHTRKDRVQRSIRWEQLTSKTICPATRVKSPSSHGFPDLCHPPQSHTHSTPRQSLSANVFVLLVLIRHTQPTWNILPAGVSVYGWVDSS